MTRERLRMCEITCEMTRYMMFYSWHAQLRHNGDFCGTMPSDAHFIFSCAALYVFLKGFKLIQCVEHFKGIVLIAMP